MSEPKKPRKHVQGRGGIYERKKGESLSDLNKRIVAYNTKKTKQSIALRKDGGAKSIVGDLSAKPKGSARRRGLRSSVSSRMTVGRGKATAKTLGSAAKSAAKKGHKTASAPKKAVKSAVKKGWGSLKKSGFVPKYKGK